MPKPTKMEPKGCRNEPRDLPKHPLGNRVEKVRKMLDSQGAVWSQLGVNFGQKSTNLPSKRSWKIRSAKNMNNYVKSVPKLSQKLCKNALKIDAKTGREKDEENHEQSCSFDV